MADVTREYAIIEAPSVLGLRPTGVERLPEALLGAGLETQLRARRVGRVEPPPYDHRRDPGTLMLNPQGIAEYTPRLADAIGRVLGARDFPVVLGGDCSIVLGGLLALRRRTATRISTNPRRTPTAKQLRRTWRWRPAEDLKS
jgi:arginase